MFFQMFEWTSVACCGRSIPFVFSTSRSLLSMVDVHHLLRRFLFESMVNSFSEGRSRVHPSTVASSHRRKLYRLNTNKRTRLNLDPFLHTHTHTHTYVHTGKEAWRRVRWHVDAARTTGDSSDTGHV